MRFIVSNDAIWDETLSPCDGAYKVETRRWDLAPYATEADYEAKHGQSWRSRGTDHGTYIGGIRRCLGMRIAWAIDIDSDDDLRRLMNTYAQFSVFSPDPENFGSSDLARLVILDHQFIRE